MTRSSTRRSATTTRSSGTSYQSTLVPFGSASETISPQDGSRARAAAVSTLIAHVHVEAREVEQLLEQPPSGARPARRRLATALGATPSSSCPSRSSNVVEDAVHGRRRRSQLVRGDRDEVQLHLVELHGLLVEPARSIAIATRSATSCSSSRSSRVNRRWTSVPTWITPITSPCDEQRHAEHRLDPLLAQDRIEHVRVVDVVEDHRLPLGGDPPGEAAADRDANALLDLFLDPDRRPRDELVGRLVEQEHRARVRLEDVADSRQQHREQLVELEVRERRVGDRLHVLEPLPRLGAPPRRRVRARSRSPHGRRRAATAPRRPRRSRAVHERADVEHAEHSRRRRSAARRAST